MIRPRHELKYRVSEAQALALAGYVRAFMEPDPHAPGGKYVLSSLYLDTHDLRLCRESLTGVKNRLKLRIRCYSDEPEAPCFLEIKRRINQVIVKSRSCVPRCVVPPLLERGWSPSALGLGCTDASLAQFLYYRAQLQACPLLRVRYERESYQNPRDDVRVTFDRQLSVLPTAAAQLGLNGPGWQPCGPRAVVFEIKFTRGYPRWVERMVEVFGLQATSNSKYVFAVTRACGQRRLLAQVRGAGASAPAAVVAPEAAPPRVGEWDTAGHDLAARGAGPHGAIVAIS
jgi:hypothetical protein